VGNLNSYLIDINIKFHHYQIVIHFFGNFVVGRMTRLWVGRSRNYDLIPGRRGEYFFLLQSLQTDIGSHPVFYSVTTGELFSAQTAQSHGVPAEFKKESGCSSSASIRHRVMYRDNFTFTCLGLLRTTLQCVEQCDNCD
jgi:hypothetical protein